MDIWAGFELGTDGLSARYCEVNRLGAWIRQPVNTISNLVYLAAGLVVWADGRRPGHLRGALRAILGAALVALFVGSSLFHASIARFAQRMDVGATYALALALIGSAVAVQRPARERTRWVAATLAAAAVFAGVDLLSYGTILLPALILSALVAVLLAWRRRPGLHDARYLAFSGLMLAASAASWWLDFAKVGCDPTSAFQWHAVWHLSTAAAAVGTYRFLDRAPVPAL
jgi:hypothetical protein